MDAFSKAQQKAVKGCSPSCRYDPEGKDGKPIRRRARAIERHSLLREYQEYLADMNYYAEAGKAS